MSAPKLSEDWQNKLAELPHNWDSYGAKPITSRAIMTLENFSVVPLSNGGIQLEAHQGDTHVEIVIGPDGTISQETTT